MEVISLVIGRDAIVHQVPTARFTWLVAVHQAQLLIILIIARQPNVVEVYLLHRQQDIRQPLIIVIKIAQMEPGFEQAIILMGQISTLLQQELVL